MGVLEQWQPKLVVARKERRATRKQVSCKILFHDVVVSAPSLWRLSVSDIDDLDAILKEVELQTKQTETKQAVKKKGKGKIKSPSQLTVLPCDAGKNAVADSAQDENAPDGDAKNGNAGAAAKEAYLAEIAKLKPIDEQITDGNYPVGEICEYRMDKDDRTAVNRMTNEVSQPLVSMTHMEFVGEEGARRNLPRHLQGLPSRC